MLYILLVNDQLTSLFTAFFHTKEANLLSFCNTLYKYLQNKDFQAIQYAKLMK
jgi:hypothetical protein